MILLWPTEELQNLLYFLIYSDIPRCAGVKLSRSQVWVFLFDLVYTVQPPKSGDLLKQAVIPSDLYLIFLLQESRVEMVVCPCSLVMGCSWDVDGSWEQGNVPIHPWLP